MSKRSQQRRAGKNVPEEGQVTQWPQLLWTAPPSLPCLEPARHPRTQPSTAPSPTHPEPGPSTEMIKQRRNQGPCERLGPEEAGSRCLGHNQVRSEGHRWSSGLRGAGLQLTAPPSRTQHILLDSSPGGRWTCAFCSTGPGRPAQCPAEHRLVRWLGPSVP